MKKEDTNFKFVIGRLSYNDPYKRALLMDGNMIVQTIYKTDTKDTLLASVECLRALAKYADGIADEYVKAITITV